jgi:hemerythrin-like metal-binding protein
MPALTWDADLATNVRMMDGQHRLLMGFLSNLHQAINEKQDREAIGEILAQVNHGTLSHFATEERLMLAIEYPAYARHKAEHDALMDRLSQVMGQFNTGSTPISADLATFLQEWLAQHIREADRRFGHYLKRRGIE